MEITIKMTRRDVTAEVSVEVCEYLDQSKRKAENFTHERRRHWDDREFDEYIVAAEGLLPYCATPEELVCQRETWDEIMAVLALCTATQRKRERYKQEHEAELASFDTAVRFLDDLKESGETITPKAWRAEVERLTEQKSLDYQKMRAMRDDLKAVESLCKTAERLASEGQNQHDKKLEER